MDYVKHKDVVRDDGKRDLLNRKISLLGIGQTVMIQPTDRGVPVHVTVYEDLKIDEWLAYEQCDSPFGKCRAGVFRITRADILDVVLDEGQKRELERYSQKVKRQKERNNVDKQNNQRAHTGSQEKADGYAGTQKEARRGSRTLWKWFANPRQ